MLCCFPLTLSVFYIYAFCGVASDVVLIPRLRGSLPFFLGTAGIVFLLLLAALSNGWIDCGFLSFSGWAGLWVDCFSLLCMGMGLIVLFECKGRLN